MSGSEKEDSTTVATDKSREIIAQGYTVIDSLVNATNVALFRRIAERRRSERDLYISGSDLFFTQPELILPIVGSSKVLDIVEKIVGPFVQLDSFSLVGIASGCQAAISWHRDPFGSVPRGTEFQRPLAMNLLIFLQNLSEETGPFRIIPGSHRAPIVMDYVERTRPHPAERLIYAKAGDGVLIHNNLVHSRSANKSQIDRLHISIVYSLSCMRPSIDVNMAPIREIVKELRKVGGNTRLLRLFGDDAFTSERYNSGFLCADEETWSDWIESDLQHDRD